MLEKDARLPKGESEGAERCRDCPCFTMALKARAGRDFCLMRKKIFCKTKPISHGPTTIASLALPVEESVGPDGDSAEGRGDGGVVDEELVVHHLELRVAADPQVGRAHADHGAVGDVGETLNDEPGQQRGLVRFYLNFVPGLIIAS